MSALTTENALRQQANGLAKECVDLLTNTFTAADLRLLLVDSLQKLDALSPPEVNEGETKISNVGSTTGGPQPKRKKKLMKNKAKAKLKMWIKEYDGGVKNHGEPNTWDVTLVTDMSKLFLNMETFNAPIDQWNTSQVTNMSSMFKGASSFNQPITMDTSNVHDMRYMFKGASSFNQPITMDTSKVVNMSGMFNGASLFNQPNTMDTSKVINMKGMFNGATAMTHSKPSLSKAVSNFF